MNSSPFRWTRQTDKLREIWDKQINYTPHVQVLYVTPAQWQLLKAALPADWVASELRYRGKLIKAVPG